MSKILDVHYDEKIIGQLEQDRHGDMIFTYASAWLSDENAFQISCSLPLREESYKRKDCRAFFGGLLPEASQRQIIAKNLGITANNDYSLLAKIGGECAGALSFMSHGEKNKSEKKAYHPIKENELAKILKELPKKPLLAGDIDVRLSLAGVQDKVAVYINGNTLAIPLDSSPSTHIIKPDFGIYEGVVYNEAFCMNLAKSIGMHVANVECKQIENIEYLLVERYDRVNLPQVDGSTRIARLHQEDFCQALAIPAINKYQNEGGPSLKQCFELVRNCSKKPVSDLSRLLQAVSFNYLIGNCDAHGKNFSLIYNNKEIHLSPLYDLLSTVYYKELDKRMAMKMGGEYRITHIVAENIEKMAIEIQFTKAEVYRVFIEQVDAILASLEKLPILNEVQENLSALIKQRCLDVAIRLKRI